MPTKEEWKREEKHLGVDTDAEIGRRLRVTRERVRQVRRGFGIGKATFIRAHQWTAEEISLLGDGPDTTAASSIGVSITTIGVKRKELGIMKASRARKWTSTEIAMLGTMPDRKIADALGIAPQTAFLKRRDLRIPPCRIYRKKRS